MHDRRVRNWLQASEPSDFQLHWYSGVHHLPDKCYNCDYLGTKPTTSHISVTIVRPHVELEIVAKHPVLGLRNQPFKNGCWPKKGAIKVWPFAKVNMNNPSSQETEEYALLHDLVSTMQDGLICLTTRATTVTHIAPAQRIPRFSPINDNCLLTQTLQTRVWCSSYQRTLLENAML